jgi:hypothetical protein
MLTLEGPRDRLMEAVAAAIHAEDGKSKRTKNVFFFVSNHQLRSRSADEFPRNEISTCAFGSKFDRIGRRRQYVLNVRFGITGWSDDIKVSAKLMYFR